MSARYAATAAAVAIVLAGTGWATDFRPSKPGPAVAPGFHPHLETITPPVHHCADPVVVGLGFDHAFHLPPGAIPFGTDSYDTPDGVRHMRLVAIVSNAGDVRFVAGAEKPTVVVTLHGDGAGDRELGRGTIGDMAPREYRYVPFDLPLTGSSNPLAWSITTSLNNPKLRGPVVGLVPATGDCDVTDNAKTQRLF